MDKCFAELPNKCRALNIKKCNECSFKKTEKSLIDSQKKTLKRINLLDVYTQFYISEKYPEFEKFKRKFSRKDDLYE